MGPSPPPTLHHWKHFAHWVMWTKFNTINTITKKCVCACLLCSSLQPGVGYTAMWTYIYVLSLYKQSVHYIQTHTHTHIYIYICEQVLFVRFYNNPAPLNGSMQFHYCTLVTREPEQTMLFVLKRGVWRNATWPSHSRPAIAARARLFQICFSPLTFWPLVCLPTLCLLSPFNAPSHE